MAKQDFNDQIKSWFDEHGFNRVLAAIQQISTPKDRVNAYLALAAFGQPKISSKEPEIKKLRDITIILQEDPGNE